MTNPNASNPSPAVQGIPTGGVLGADVTNPGGAAGANSNTNLTAQYRNAVPHGVGWADGLNPGVVFDVAEVGIGVGGNAAYPAVQDAAQPVALGVLAGFGGPNPGVAVTGTAVTLEALVTEADSIGQALDNLHRAATWIDMARVFRKTTARPPNTNVSNLMYE
jgi:hypothetical protein